LLQPQHTLRPDVRCPEGLGDGLQVLQLLGQLPQQQGCNSTPGTYCFTWACTQGTKPNIIPRAGVSPGCLRSGYNKRCLFTGGAGRWTTG
jgi:hypothetical protein